MPTTQEKNLKILFEDLNSSLAKLGARIKILEDYFLAHEIEIEEINWSVDTQADNFKKWRKQMKWSQKDLAKRFGFSVRQVLNWEKGYNEVPKAVYYLMGIISGNIERFIFEMEKSEEKK